MDEHQRQSQPPKLDLQKTKPSWWSQVGNHPTPASDRAKPLRWADSARHPTDAL
eukprot:CAMPEP_0172165742 /NCGR_PEP_ID=MMETSP1050-20130122/8587_1 /TAXON_ID=233186 /ORGANISM="Cryptomonas curvata, Strain CCAP979/52" /LENGTH=53 /DNA_ID=CAMNT_0012836259 /DNA_START=228 /DNA_END=386 /DNA_ORIENTATION=+